MNDRRAVVISAHGVFEGTVLGDSGATKVVILRDARQLWESGGDPSFWEMASRNASVPIDVVDRYDADGWEASRTVPEWEASPTVPELVIHDVRLVLLLEVKA